MNRTLTTFQLEQLQQIATYLQQLRQEQSLSLDDIAAKTFIPLRLLRAIEAGQVDLLPEPVFIQGFIRRYADLLGLDGIAIARQFPVNPLPTELPSPSPESPSSKTSPPQPKRSRVSSPAPFQSRYLAIGLVAILAIGGGLYAITRTNPSGPSSSDSSGPATGDLPPPIDVPSDFPPESSPVTAESPSPTAEPTASAQEAPVQVEVTLTGESWMRVTVDGTTEFEGMLPQGTQRRWNGQEQIVIRAGNAGAVSVAFNGEPAVLAGEPGNVETLTFTADPSAQ